MFCTVYGAWVFLKAHTPQLSLCLIISGVLPIVQVSAVVPGHADNVEQTTGLADAKGEVTSWVQKAHDFMNIRPPLSQMRLQLLKAVAAAWLSQLADSRRSTRRGVSHSLSNFLVWQDFDVMITAPAKAIMKLNDAVAAGQVKELGA